MNFQSLKFKLINYLNLDDNQDGPMYNCNHCIHSIRVGEGELYCKFISEQGECDILFGVNNNETCDFQEKK